MSDQTSNENLYPTKNYNIYITPLGKTIATKSYEGTVNGYDATKLGALVLADWQLEYSINIVDMNVQYA